MTDAALAGCRILLIEDEYVIMDELRSELRRAGAEVVGPAATLTQACRLIAANDRIDAAVLDINLRGEISYAAADALQERDVPFVFSTGYDAEHAPARFVDVARCQKPASAGALIGAVCAAMARSPTPPRLD